MLNFFKNSKFWGFLTLTSLVLGGGHIMGSQAGYWLLNDKLGLAAFFVFVLSIIVWDLLSQKSVEGKNNA